MSISSSDFHCLWSIRQYWHVPPALTFSNFAFNPQSIFIGFILTVHYYVPKQTWCVFFALETELLNAI
jgi:hypothetical protein